MLVLPTYVNKKTKVNPLARHHGRDPDIIFKNYKGIINFIFYYNPFFSKQEAHFDGDKVRF